MTISFSGLASGLDTSSWVEALVSTKQQKITSLQTDLSKTKTKKNTLTETRTVFTNFRNSLEKITDKKFGGVFDLFNQTTASSSNADVFTATAGTGAVKQDYQIAVQQLATYSKATSKEAASAVADDSTVLTSLGFTKGNFAVYVDGVKTKINIEEDNTLGDLRSQLEAAGVDFSIDASGVVTIASADPSKELHVGSTTDSTNFAAIVGLKHNEDGTYSSTNSLFKANLSTVLTAEDSGFREAITQGSFTIGNATFNITDTTTLSSLITQINNSAEAQATAYWDDTTGKLNLISKKEGASYINIEAGTSNFTDVMGLTTTDRDGEGNIISSKMYTDTQELGKNALFTINGTSMVSTSNTVTSDVSRINGVTLTLNKVSSEEDGESTLKVAQDTSSLVSAVKDFIDAYNNTVDKIDEVTATGADFQRESALTSFKSTIRSYANGANTYNGGIYKLLSDIGISTGDANGNNLSTDTQTLQFDEEKFLNALEENPESVEAILGDENGILNQMENAVEQMLKSVSGFFDVKTTTLDSEITKTETRIKNQQEKVSAYQTQLEKKFSNMELLISQMQQNYSSFLTSS